MDLPADLARLCKQILERVDKVAVQPLLVPLVGTDYGLSAADDPQLVLAILELLELAGNLTPELVEVGLDHLCHVLLHLLRAKHRRQEFHWQLFKTRLHLGLQLFNDTIKFVAGLYHNSVLLHLIRGEILEARFDVLLHLI